MATRPYKLLPPEVIEADPSGYAQKVYDRQVRDLLNRFVDIIGNGVDNTFVINHKLNSQDAIANVYATTAPYGEPVYTVRHTDANHTTIIFSSVPTAKQYRVVIRA